MTTLRTSIALLGLTLALGSDASAGNWATSWYAAPQPGWDQHFVLPMNVPALLEKQTVQESLRLSTGGERFRLVFSNRYGRDTLALGRELIVRGVDVIDCSSGGIGGSSNMSAVPRVPGFQVGYASQVEFTGLGPSPVQ